MFSHTSSIVRPFFACFLAGLALAAAESAELNISSASLGGTVVLTNTFTNGIATVKRATAITGPWSPIKNVFTSNTFAEITVEPSLPPVFYRATAVDLPPTPEGFTNLIHSWSTLSTLAGKGDDRRDNTNNWEAAFEGGLAIHAELSRPHFAMADAAGNIYIADKNAHAIRKVTPEGKIFTVAGTNEAGDGGDSWEGATINPLNAPNGLWVQPDGTFYIVDSGNRKIRRVDPQGEMITLFYTWVAPHRGLWVNPDETLAYFAATQQVMKWTPDGVQWLASGFEDLGNLVVDPDGRLVVTDRGANRVYRVYDDGNVEPIAGNGLSTGGGDGSLALETGLHGVRAIWFLPNGSYFLATHEGSQVWHVDTAGVIRLFLNGAPREHSGDGAYFRTPGFKVSEIRSITMDYEGNLLITEHDAGYIRKIDFLRMP